MSADNLGEAILKLSTDDKSLDSGIDRAQSKAARLGKSFDKVGRAATRNLTLPIIAAGTAAAKFSLDFESSLSKITGLVGVSREQVQAWRGDILKLAPAVGKGPKELADAMFFITSAGLRGQEALDLLTASAKASAAGLGDTAVIADAATSAMNAFGSDTLSAAQATNILVATVREGKLEAAALSGVLGRVIPTAAAMGVTFDQVGAAIAAMSRLSGSAEMSVTQFAAVLSSLQKVTPDAEKALNEFGFSSAKVRQQIREGGLLDVLTDLKDRIGDNDTAMARIFPNVEALRGVLSLVGENAESTGKIFKSLADDTTALDNGFEAAALTGKFKLAAGMAEIKTALISLGDAVTPVIIPMFQKMARFIGQAAFAFRNLTPETQAMIVKVGLLVAALGPVLVGLGFLVTALSAILAPIPLIVIAVAGLAAAIALNWDAIVASTKALFQGVKLWLVDKFMAVIRGVKTATDAVVGFFDDMFMAVVGGSIVPDMMDGVDKAFSGVGASMTGPTQKATVAVTQSFETMADRVKKALAGIDASLVSTTQILGMFDSFVSGLDRKTTLGGFLKRTARAIGNFGKAVIAAGVAAGTITLGVGLAATVGIGLAVAGAVAAVDAVGSKGKSPDTDSTPSASLAAAGGTSGTVINVNISSSVVTNRQSVDALIVPALQQIDRTGGLKLGSKNR